MTGQATMDFAAEIDAAWLEMMGGIRSALIYLATEGLARVQEKSPVDLGTFRANWLVSIGSPSDKTTMTLAEFGALSASAIASYATVEGFPIIYLQNNLPYALRLENGWSAQAPNGVLAITVAELAAIAEGMAE